jgi:hypothetical protein
MNCSFLFGAANDVTNYLQIKTLFEKDNGKLTLDYHAWNQLHVVIVVAYYCNEFLRFHNFMK